ncbi:MAG: hypothetical protein FD149_1224 [Rhodospirillaceae bacterium]|nr:MAG: hypothetical protein FD149_1224 [Rhodospirillaceae bacterium]
MTRRPMPCTQKQTNDAFEVSQRGIMFNFIHEQAAWSESPPPSLSMPFFVLYGRIVFLATGEAKTARMDAYKPILRVLAFCGMLSGVSMAETDQQHQTRILAQQSAHYHLQVKIGKVELTRERQYAVPCILHGTVVRAFRGPVAPAKPVSFAHTCILDGSLLPTRPDASWTPPETPPF